MTLEELNIKITAQTAQAVQGINNVTKSCNEMGKQVQQATEKTQTGFKKLVSGIGWAALIAKVFQFGRACVDMSSMVEKSLKVVRTSFDETAGSLDNYMKMLQKYYGYSKKGASGIMQSSLTLATSTGMGSKEATQLTKALTERAADIGSALGRTTSEMESAIEGVLTGNTRSLRNLGIVMNDSLLEQYSQKMGYGAYGQLTEDQQLALRGEYFMQATGQYAGAYAENQGSDYATVQADLESSIEDLKDEIGASLKPALTDIINAVTQFLPTVQGVIDTLNKISAAFTPLINALAGSVLDVIASVLEVIGEVLIAIKPILDLVLPVLTALVSAVGALIRWIQYGLSQLASELHLYGVKEWLAGAGEWVNGITNWLNDQFNEKAVNNGPNKQINSYYANIERNTADTATATKTTAKQLTTIGGFDELNTIAKKLESGDINLDINNVVNVNVPEPVVKVDIFGNTNAEVNANKESAPQRWQTVRDRKLSIMETKFPFIGTSYDKGDLPIGISGGGHGGGHRFAKGGVLRMPTVGLMGEYPGASSNPEIVTPQNIMRETMIEANGQLAGVFQQVGQYIVNAIQGQNLEVTIGDDVIARSAARGNKNYYKQTGGYLI